METSRGTVVSVVRRAGATCAIVDVETAACPRCAAGRGCGAGLPAPRRRVELPVDPALGLAAGDAVDLRLEPTGVLKAALIVYGGPLGGALAAAALAYGMRLDDAAAAAAALLGIGVGVLASRLRLARSGSVRGFLPFVDKAS
jgi:positive regulator of sigma E activity